jgi:hypothetical protein
VVEELRKEDAEVIHMGGIIEGSIGSIDDDVLVHPEFLHGTTWSQARCTPAPSTPGRRIAIAGSRSATAAGMRSARYLLAP